MKHKLHDQFEHKYREDACLKILYFLKIEFQCGQRFCL
jgi:hypothetical protein